MGKLAIKGGKPFFKNAPSVKWPTIDSEDERFVLESLNGTNHSYGANCSFFEKEFSAWNKTQFSINTNSGTAALHMCLAAIGCGAGDEIIVPAYSWSSTATVVLHHNCIPVFVDIDWETSNMDPHLIEEVITSKTKAIVVAHLHGTPANMKLISAVASKNGLFIIEDACQSHGARIDNIPVGNWGHCAAFSFNQNKTICAGDAGMFVTNDSAFYELARRFWSFGENRLPNEERDYHAYALGWMYRSNDLTAAFGRGQLKKADQYIRRQRESAFLLSDYLKGSDILLLPNLTSEPFCTYSSYVIRLNKPTIPISDAAFRDLFVQALEQEGLSGHIAVWQKYILPNMTVFRAKNAYGNGCPWDCQSASIQPPVREFPVSQKHCDSSFCLNTILRLKPNESFIRNLANCILKVAENSKELWNDL